MKRAERLVLLGIVVAVGLLLRCWFVGTSKVEGPLRADAGQYAQYAQNLVEYGTFSLATDAPPRPDSFRSPGYPAFLAACRLVAGESWYSLARWLQAVLSALLVPLAFALARPVVPFWGALAAALLTALSPHLIVASGYVLTETLFAVAFGSALLLLLAARRAQRCGKWFAAAGLALGLAALVNEAAAPLVVLFGLAVFRTDGRHRGLCFVLAGLVPLGAWQGRNATQDLARTGGERAVATLSHGSYPDLFFATERNRNFPYREDPEQPEFGSSWSRFAEVMRQRVGAEPLRYLRWYVLDKPRWLWRWDIAQGAGGVQVYPVHHNVVDDQPVVAGAATLLRWLHWPLCLLCLGGGVWSLRRRSALAPLRPLAIALLWFTCLYTLFLPDPRYLVPLRPLQMVLAAAAVAGLLQLRRGRSGAGGGIAGAEAVPADDTTAAHAEVRDESESEPLAAR